MGYLPNRINRPPWWQLIRWIADPIGFQDQYHQQYGDFFTMRLSGLGSYVFVSQPAAIAEILSQDSKAFDVGRSNALAEPLVGKNSVMLLDGDRHRRERKLLMPPFHGERLQTYAQQICSMTETVAGQWQPNQPFEIRAAMQSISLEIILQIVFGLKQGHRYQKLKSLLTDWIDMTNSPLRSSILFFKFLQTGWGWTPWGKMKQRQSKIHNLLQAEIQERRENDSETGTDILSLMMAVRDEAGQAMTDEELRDELLTLLFAGHETTATTLAWAFYQIYRHPNILSQLQQELQDKDVSSDPMAVTQLPYLTAVCQETLRMYPVIPSLFARTTKSAMTLAGHQFDADTTFLPSVYLVHYRPDLYPNPTEFQPERFLERTFTPNEYMPFGGGSRRCIGYALAQLELKLILATVLTHYPLKLVNQKPVKRQRRGFTLAPVSGIKMVAISNPT